MNEHKIVALMTAEYKNDFKMIFLVDGCIEFLARRLVFFQTTYTTITTTTTSSRITSFLRRSVTTPKYWRCHGSLLLTHHHPLERGVVRALSHTQIVGQWTHSYVSSSSSSSSSLSSSSSYCMYNVI